MLTLRAFEPVHLDLEVSSLPPGGPPLTLAHISDLHLRRWGPQHEELVRAVAAQDVDLVLITGDTFSQYAGSVPCAERLLRALRARHGVFLVRGNWELAVELTVHRLHGMLEGWGATLLANEVKLVPTATGPVCVAGLDDPLRGWPDIEHVMAQMGPERGLTLMLCHTPVGADLLPAHSGVDLMLCGHTHGGQVRVPLWRHLLRRRYYGGMTDGLYQRNGMHVYISRGFGGVGYVPVRFRCPAEVAFVAVRPPERGD